MTQLIPLDRIRPSDANPRTHFDEERMAELVASVKRHGIITPLTLTPDGDGFVIVAGERRYRAAKAAKLTEVPAHVRDTNEATLAVAVAENVIRADLTPIEEARAYQALAAEHGGAAAVAKLVGKSERLIEERLGLLTLPDEVQERIATRAVPLGCAAWLRRIAEAEPLLARLVASWLAQRPADAPTFSEAPGDIVDGVLRTAWTDDGAPIVPVAYSVSTHRGPITAPADDHVAAILGKLGEHAARVAEAYDALPPIVPRDGHDWEAARQLDRRERECFRLDEIDADAARAYGCLLELPIGPDRTRGYITDPAWLAERLLQHIATHAIADAERTAESRPGPTVDDAERERRRAERTRLQEQRAAAHRRNLDLGAALARWQPKLDTDAVKLLGRIVLDHHGKAAAWAHRLLIDQPTETNKSGTVLVRYPRGTDAEAEHHAAALAALDRARTPEDALAIVLRLLVALRLADTTGLAQADRQGIHEPEILRTSDPLTRIAKKVAPASVRRHQATARQEEEPTQQAA